MRLSPFLLIATVLAGAVSGFAAAQREEAVGLFEGRKVAVAVPAGFSFESGRDEAGMINLHLADERSQVSLQLVFLPDAGSEAARARGRREKMVELFDRYVAGSVEKAMRFEELEPRRGAGTYCVFTDAALVGRTELPPNEYHHLTAGLKAWPGVVVVFRLFSNETTSAGYQAALKLLRESVEERPVPLR